MYRPLPSQVNQLNTNVFLREWAEFLSQYTTSTAELIIVGDINIHLDNTTHPHTTDLMHTLQSCGLQQHINQPTHHHGHTLDVLITRDTSAVIGNVDVKDIADVTIKTLFFKATMRLPVTFFYPQFQLN